MLRVGAGVHTSLGAPWPHSDSPARGKKESRELGHP